MPSFTIRRASADDPPGIHDVHEQAVRRICTLDYSPEEIDAWVGGPRTEPDPAEARRVATGDGVVIGFSGLRGDEVWAVYVHPDWLRRGVGTALLREAEQKALHDGVSRLRLHASLGAVPFYAANGYRTIQTTTHLLGGRVPIRCVQMTKELRATGPARPPASLEDPTL